MPIPALQPLRALALLAAFLTAAPAAGAPDEISGGLTSFAGEEKPRDAISPRQLAEGRAAIAAYEKRKALAPAVPKTPKDDSPFLYPFFPQAGIQGKDLYLSNFTDQNPSLGIFRDWDCTEQTYDDHHGHDSLIRSFREQAIGVPVFAVRDGVVVQTHDGEPDMNTEWSPRNQANYVIVDHGQGYFAWYFHLRAGSVAVSPGQAVTAGTQLGLTGSSGFSNWPHLHFETEKDGHWIEPSAGQCRPGDSLWVSQPPVPRDFYVADFYLAQGIISIPDRDTWLLDQRERKATFVKGSQTVGMRIDFRNLPARTGFRGRVLSSRGAVVSETSGSFGNDVPYELAFATFWFNVNLDSGTWRFQAFVNDDLVVNAPFRVVANSGQAKNRRPNAIKTRLSPAHPVDGQVLTCEVLSSLMARDPDYDIVSYRYEWRVKNRVVRSVTSAAMTDLLAAGTAKPKDKVSCRVTPSDGKSKGLTAVAAGLVEEP